MRLWMLSFTALILLFIAGAIAYTVGDITRAASRSANRADQNVECSYREGALSIDRQTRCHYGL